MWLQYNRNHIRAKVLERPQLCCLADEKVVFNGEKNCAPDFRRKQLQFGKSIFLALRHGLKPQSDKNTRQIDEKINNGGVLLGKKSQLAIRSGSFAIHYGDYRGFPFWLINFTKMSLHECFPKLINRLFDDCSTRALAKISEFGEVDYCSILPNDFIDRAQRPVNYVLILWLCSNCRSLLEFCTKGATKCIRFKCFCVILN